MSSHRLKSKFDRAEDGISKLGNKPEDTNRKALTNL